MDVMLFSLSTAYESFFSKNQTFVNERQMVEHFVHKQTRK